MKQIDRFDCLSPLDYRYQEKGVAEYLSENAFNRYKLMVELALVKVLHKRGMCSEAVVKDVEKACLLVTADEVYEEEERIKHDIRALVNCIRDKVSDEAKPFVHMMATSYDIVDSANALRYRDAVEKELVPCLMKLEKTLIEIALREAETVQIGRTHGQHAVPITFGFAMAGYVSRLGKSIQTLKAFAQELTGKFSGAVGAYNASTLFFENPEGFEEEILAELGLKPAEHSTQVVPPEALTRLFSEITIVAGVMANLADDMRHLQRTEIEEVGEAFEEKQVGSSTMAHKRNPINFENVKSCWKIVVSRMLTVFMDQISEHQRDLTNSASGRTYGEVIAYVVSMTKRLTRTMKKLSVDKKKVEQNLEMKKGLIVAEPLYILLASMGHPDAHEKVRLLTLQAQKEKKSLEELALGDLEIVPYLERMDSYQRKIISDPVSYIGIAAKKAKTIAERWQKELEI